MEVRGTAGSHFKTNVSAPLLDLLLTGAKPLPGARLQVSGPVLRVIRPDGWVEDVGSVLDLKVEGIVRPGDFVNGAEDLLLSNETEGTILRGEEEG